MTDDYTPDLFSVQTAYVYADEYSRVTYEERKEAFNRFIRKVKADAIREIAIKAQETFIAEQNGLGFARIRTSWIFDQANQIQRWTDD